MTDINQSCQVGGVKLHLRRGGHGRPILFLHGAGGVSEWTPFFQELAKSHDTWVPDHPGFGKSEDPDFIKNMSDLAMFYLDFLDEHAPKEGFDLVGHSIGGWLAAEIATRNSQHINSVTFVSSAGLRLSGQPMGDVFIWNAEESVEHLIFDPLVREKRLKAQPSPEEAEIMVRNKFTFAKLAWHPRLFNPELKKWLHRIKVPTQVIWGEHDGLIPQAYAKLWADELKTQECTILSECSHSPINEKPMETAQLINTFLGKLAS